MKKEQIEALDRKALVAEAKKIGVEKAHAMKSTVLVEALEKHFGITAQLGRPVNPDSDRQIRLAELDKKREAGELNRGRPIDMTSARQMKIAETTAKREAGTLVKGRPVDPTSARQLKIAEMKVKKEAGIEVKRGRPKAEKVEETEDSK